MPCAPPQPDRLSSLELHFRAALIAARGQYNRRWLEARPIDRTKDDAAVTKTQANAAARLLSLALLAQLVEHLHGKEGVNGSSPLEGFTATPGTKPFTTTRRGSIRASASYLERIWNGRHSRLGGAFPGAGHDECP